jgi:hypothetical protein
VHDPHPYQRTRSEGTNQRIRFVTTVNRNLSVTSVGGEPIEVRPRLFVEDAGTLLEHAGTPPFEDAGGTLGSKALASLFGRRGSSLESLVA